MSHRSSRPPQVSARARTSRPWATVGAAVGRAAALTGAVATVLVSVGAGYAVSPASGPAPGSSTDPATGQARGGAAATTTTTSTTRPPFAATRDSHALVDRIGIATYNVDTYRDPGAIAADLTALASRPDVDLIGWQEADGLRDQLHDLARLGWSTRYVGGDAAENAISWRRDEFALESSQVHRAHPGAGPPRTTDPFPARYVSSVTLVHRDSRERLTLLDTHLNQATEQVGSAPGTWRRNLNAVEAKVHLRLLAQLWRDAPGRWVLGTGDLNIDYRAESRARPPGGPSVLLDGLAASSYELLGLAGLAPTHPGTGRWIDYVLTDARPGRADRVGLDAQRVLDGYGSDHRPLLVRATLR